MRGSAGSGNDRGEATLHRGLRVVEKQVGRSVRRDDAGFMGNAQPLQHFHCVTHRFPIGLGTHHDADSRLSGRIFHRGRRPLKPLLYAYSAALQPANFAHPMDKRLLDILCCPTTKSPLRLLTEAELAALNSAILADGVVTANGTRTPSAITNGLITRDGRSIYRLDDDIPVMLADEAIATAQIANFPRT